MNQAALVLVNQGAARSKARAGNNQSQHHDEQHRVHADFISPVLSSTRV
jgi:hypothetical protein